MKGNYISVIVARNLETTKTKRTTFRNMRTTSIVIMHTYLLLENCGEESVCFWAPQNQFSYKQK